MNRRIAALAIAGVALLGLTACSGATDGSASKPKDTSASQGTEESTNTGGDQSVADACAAINSVALDAQSSLGQIDPSAAAKDPQGTVDAFGEVVDKLGGAVDSVQNEEVKAAATAVYDDFVALRDLLSKVLVDQDTSAASEMSTITTDVQTSAQELQTLCAG